MAQTHEFVPHKPYTYNADLNPYRAKKPWPPDFTKLSPKSQFRIERRFKKRSQLKWARPKLMAWTRIAQWTAGVGIMVYGVFFLDWDREMRKPGEVGNGPFEGARRWLKDTVESLQGVRDEDLRRASGAKPRTPD